MPLPPSAADWTRFKKLGAVSRYNNTVTANTDVFNRQTPVSCAANGCSSRAGIRRDQDQAVGLGRTRREASKWIDFVASQQADIINVTEIPLGIPGFGSFGRQLNRTQICASGTRCVVTSPFQTQAGIRKSAVYQHSRIL